MAWTTPAAKLAAGYTRDEHSDFYLPARRELQLGAANLHDTFGTESWYPTLTTPSPATERGSSFLEP